MMRIMIKIRKITKLKLSYFQGLPLVILFQPAASLSEKDSMRLQEEGQNLADSLQSPFIEVTKVQANSFKTCVLFVLYYLTLCALKYGKKSKVSLEPLTIE